MKTKLKPAIKQKIKPSVKILFVSSAMAVSALMLFMVLSEPKLPVAQASSNNSGRCLTFNGISSSVTFSDNDFDLEGGSAMTVTAWIKWTNKSTAGSWATIATLNKSSTSGDVGQFWLQHSSGNSQFEFAVQNAASTRLYTQSTTNPSVGTWYHVAGVYDGSFIYMYVNGILESKTAMTGKINNLQVNFKLAFGQWAHSGDSYRRFNGNIDEVSIWNTALTQTQIRDMMCKKLVGNESGLTGYWRMNESSGSVVTDLTSNHRNGTSSNTTIAHSGAPVGDVSSYTYGGSSVTLKDSKYGDSLVLNNFSSTPAGIFIYKIDTAPNTTLPAVGYTNMSSIHYFGAFIVNSTGETYRLTYYYNGHPGVKDPSYLGLATRSDNSVLSWTDLLATLNTVNGTLRKTGQTGRNEYILVQQKMSSTHCLLNCLGLMLCTKKNR